MEFADWISDAPRSQCSCSAGGSGPVGMWERLLTREMQTEGHGHEVPGCLRLTLILFSKNHDRKQCQQSSQLLLKNIRPLGGGYLGMHCTIVAIFLSA